ncbi:MAG: hypothetical protein ABUK01_12775 [Leptospirales bacterium]
MSKWKEKFEPYADEDSDAWSDLENEEKLVVAKEFLEDVGESLDSFKIKFDEDEDDKVELRGKLDDLPVKIEVDLDDFAMEIYTKVAASAYFCLNYSLDAKEKEADEDDDWGDDDEIRKVLDGGIYLEDSDQEDIDAGVAAWTAMPDTLKTDIKAAFPYCSLEKIVVRTDEIETGYWSKENFMSTDDPLASVSGALSISAKLGKHLAV